MYKIKEWFVRNCSPRTDIARRNRRRQRVVESLEIRQLLSASFQLVKDINSFPLGPNSSPSEFVEVGSTIYFAATISGDTRIPDASGRELWKTDGTESGTVLVKDIRPGVEDSNPANLINVNGTLFFTATNGVDGTELWKSDGTASGTVMVQNIGPDNSGSNPRLLTNVDGVLYFAANNGVHGEELWVSDGTESGTRMVRDINGGPWSSAPGEFVRFRGLLYFAAIGRLNGRELWKTDGTTAGTTMVTSINEGPASASIHSMVVMNDTLYFSANDGTHGQELWKSDGTAAGTMLLKDMRSGAASSSLDSLVNVNGVLLFRNGSELWTSDGTEVGTVKVRELEAWPFSAAGLFNGVLYFEANDGVSGVDLWKSDGTTAGTVLVKDIWPGTYAVPVNDWIDELLPHGGRPGEFTNLNGTLYFTAEDGVHGREIWKTDGTTDGTVMLKDISPEASTEPGASQLSRIGGSLYFSGYDQVHGFELWKSDGTSSGTTLLKNIAASPITADSRPADFLEVDGIVYFTADDGKNGRELWRSDGTLSGTRLVKDIRAGAYGSDPSMLTNVNGVIYFVANDGQVRGEIWRSDGTASGTMRATGIAPLYSDPRVGWMTNVNGVLYFVATIESYYWGTIEGPELWKIDSTAIGGCGCGPGAVMVKNIRAGEVGSNPSELTNHNGILYFTADDGIHGSELWRSDGTTNGTVMVKDIRSGDMSSGPGRFEVVGRNIFFTANDSTHGTELWKTDGTTSGTMLVRDIRSGSLSSDPDFLTNVNGTLYFAAHDGVNGRELWKSDGTTSGTVVVKDILPGAAGIFEGPDPNFTDVVGTLYFVANDGTNGRELWRSDGTSTGTQLVTNLASGSADANPAFLTNIHGMLHFTATDGVSGTKLWKTNGTAAGTVVVKDDFAGRLGNEPDRFVATNNLLFVTNQSDPFGSELYVHNLLDGTTGDDSYVLRYSSTTTGGRITVTRSTDGQPAVLIGVYPMSESLSIDGRGGADTVRVIGSRANDLFSVNAGWLTINGSQLRLKNFAKRILDGDAGDDTYRFDADLQLPGFFLDESSGGTDTIDLSPTSTSVALNLSQAGSQVVNENLRLSLQSASTFENLFGGAGGDLLVGNSLNNSLKGNGGNDRLIGGTGDDTYVFRTAADAEADVVIEGPDAGADTLNFSVITSPVTVELGSATLQTVHRNRTVQLNTRVYVENVVGGSGDDRLMGNASDNLLIGNASHDFLIGAAGSDTLIGGSGDDNYVFTAAFASERDLVVEGPDGGVDTLDMSQLTTAVTIDLGSVLTQVVHLNRQVRLNSRIQFENVLGGSGSDRLIGNSAANTLVGNAGNDQLFGVKGRNLLIGGIGRDTIHGGVDEDILIAGRTMSDDYSSQLNVMRSLWISGESYATRVTKLRRDSGLPSVSLKAGINVLDEAGHLDSLTGGTGRDWIFKAVDDRMTDLVFSEILEFL